MAEITNHGQPGYRRGCRCEVCRAGHRIEMARYRAARKQREAQPDTKSTVEPPEHVEPTFAQGVSLDMAADPGPVEQALAAELDKLIGEPPFKETLIVLAKYNARVLDQIPRLDRVDLLSGIQSRLFNIFDRLRKVESKVGADAWDMSALTTPDD